MKKIVTLAVIFSVAIVFTGCKNQNNSCRWSPFKRDQTVCYTPCNSCDIPVVDDCCPAPYDSCGTVVSNGCATCATGGTISTSMPVVEPIPGN